MSTELLIKDPVKYSENLSIADLVKLLKKLDLDYYSTTDAASEGVPDSVYDTLVEVLAERDPSNAYFKKVGAPVAGVGTKEKVTLPFEMGSLIKIKPGNGGIDAWTKKNPGPYFISDKLDGASAQIYKNQTGEVFMYSRGDGTIGQNISHLLPLVITQKSLSLIPNGTSIRGEVIISREDFKEISDKMKNARNAISGLVNSKNVDKDVAAVAQFISYAIISPRYEYKKQMDLLEAWKLNCVTHKFVNSLTEDFFIKQLLARREKSLFEMDGIVCVDCSKIYAHAGGYREHEFAFKMQLDDQAATAIIAEVIWTPSKDGLLKPRIRINPVNLQGTTITYATAFNAKFIVDHKIGPGAVIKIVRSGDVIPYIQEIISPAKDGPQMPPFPYKWNSSGVDLILKIENDENGKSIMTIKLITHFFAKLDVKYMSEGIITKLVEAGYDSIESILEADLGDLAEIEGLGKKVVAKIFEEIDRAFDEMTLEMFMAASNKLGIGLGERKIAEVIAMYPNILTMPEDGLYDKVVSVPGFAQKSAELFVGNLPTFKKFYRAIGKIRDLTRFESKGAAAAKKGGKFDGQTFVFTGTRDKVAMDYVVSNGGKIGSAVSKTTVMLIHADDADTTSNKFTKAIELGVPLMKVSLFRKREGI